MQLQISIWTKTGLVRIKFYETDIFLINGKLQISILYARMSFI